MRPKPDIADQPDALFRRLTELGASVVGEKFFVVLVEGLAEAVRVDYAYVTELKDAEPPALEILAGFQRGESISSGQLVFADTPAEQVLRDGMMFMSDGIAAQFPDDAWLAEHDIHGYFGIALSSPRGDSIGHLCILSCKPLDLSTDLTSAMRLLAIRASAELARMRAESLQRLSAKKFSTAFQSSSSMLSITDHATGRFTDVNDAFERVLGYDVAELIGRTPLEAGFWEYPEERAAVLRDLQLGERVYNRDVHFLTKTGERRHVLMSAEIIQIGASAYVLSAMQDITDYKAALDALHQRDLTYRTLFNAGSDAIFVYTIDADGNPEQFIQVNDMACERLGYTREELLKKTPLDIVTSTDGSPPPRPGKRLLEEGSALFETILVTRSGLHIPVESNAHLFRLGGRNTVLSVVRDVSERKHAEVVQRTQLAAMEASVDGIALLDENMCYVYVNQAHRRLNRYDSDKSVLGRPWTELATEDEFARFRDEIVPAFKESGYWQGEVLGRRFDGTTYPQEISLARLPDGGAVCIVRDISERRRQEAALRETEEKFRKIFENSLEGIYQTTPDGRVISANPALANTLGYESADALLRSGANIAAKVYVHPQQRAELIRQLEERGSYSDAEFQIIKSDGSVIWVSDSARVVRDSDGRVLYYEGTIQDITARKATEEALVESEEKYRTLVDTSQDGVFIAQNDAFVYVNHAFARMLGYTPEDMLGMEFGRIIAPEDQQLASAHSTLHDDISSKPYEARLLHRDGITRSVASILVSPINYKGERGITGTVRDITEQKRTEQQLVRSAFHDALTGLPNRALFLERLRRALSAGRHGVRFAVLFLDLDRFKLINDSLGHAFGDRLLLAIANRLRTCLRPNDIIARHGGDEFTVLLEQIEGLEDVTIVADRIHEELSRAFTVDGHDVFTNASIGIVFSAEHYETPDELLRDADTAMYRAKEAGKAGYVVFDETMHQRVKDHLRTETDLRLALDRGELRVYYQPIFQLADNSLVGFEALVRWQHPQRGLLLPEHFLAVAEESGLIIPIGWWVMETACAQLRGWQRKHRQFKNLKMSVNIANRQFSHWVLPQRVARILDLTGLTPSSLCMEITESVFMESKELASETLSRLRAVGVSLQMDDFGTGFSSLSGLKNFPLDTLKIDRSFVAGIEHDPGDMAIVRTIAHLAENLEMEIVAEGVETQRQAELLRGLGCTRGQGFLYARPMPASAVETYLTTLTRR